MHPELKAIRRIARERGVVVRRKYLPRTLKGLFFGFTDPPTILLNVNISGAEAAEVLAHELGHHEAWRRGVFAWQSALERESFADAYGEHLLGRCFTTKKTA